MRINLSKNQTKSFEKILKANNLKSKNAGIDLLIISFNQLEEKAHNKVQEAIEKQKEIIKLQNSTELIALKSIKNYIQKFMARTDCECCQWNYKQLKNMKRKIRKEKSAEFIHELLQEK